MIYIEVQQKLHSAYLGTMTFSVVLVKFIFGVLKLIKNVPQNICFCFVSEKTISLSNFRI